MTTLHRDDLIRMVGMATADVEFRANGDSDHLGTLAGYAAVFDSPTDIDSWEGRFTEVMAPGAFRKTLTERGDQVKVLFNHGMDPSIGEKPLGRPAVLEERDRGLYVEVPLDDTSYNKDLVASIRSGALDGMSIRFSVAKEDVDDTGDVPVRTVREAKLYEFGPVTFPAYEATTAGIRGRKAYEMWRNSHVDPQVFTVTADGYNVTVDDEIAAAPSTASEPAPRPLVDIRERWLTKADAMDRILGPALRNSIDERTSSARNRRAAR